MVIWMSYESWTSYERRNVVYESLKKVRKHNSQLNWDMSKMNYEMSKLNWDMSKVIKKMSNLFWKMLKIHVTETKVTVTVKPI